MLLLLYRNCCRILWKPLNNHNKQRQQHHRPPQQQYIIWLFLLFLLSQQHGTHCRPTSNWNHRAQRRFMWKQMDSTVDGFVGRVVTGARVMKGMIGEFMPHNKQAQGNVLDYLPTETTRVKYIIRNPHTKETKVIKIRPSKKVVKIMAMTPKPLMAEKHKPTTHMLDPGKLRQLEREQELIAEGRQPMKHEARPSFMGLTEKHQKDASKGNAQRDASQDDNDTVSGSISEFGDSWKPVYKASETPTSYSTVKPSMMSALHTSIVGELLPQPEKQVYEPLYESSDYREHDSNKLHTYEVTEYTAEESVMQPYAHEYYSYKDIPAPSSSLRLSSQRHPPPIETQNVVSHEEETVEEPHEYRSQRGIPPSRTSYRSNTETTTPAVTTTTTEEPNYPAGFLKRYRERNEAQYHAKLPPRNKPVEIVLENTWLPSNASYSNTRNKPTHHHHSLSLGTRTKSQKWPPPVEDTQNSDSSFEVAVTTEPPTSPQEYATHTPLPSLGSGVRHNGGHTRKNVRLKSHHGTTAAAASTTNAEYHRPRNGRQRGSIRFGDKLEPDEG